MADHNAYHVGELGVLRQGGATGRSGSARAAEARERRKSGYDTRGPPWPVRPSAGR